MTRSVEQVILSLQECLCARIEEQAAAGVVPNVCICTVVAGAGVPLDYCTSGGCDGDGCGIAWVRLLSVGPAQDSIEIRGCAVPLQAMIEIGIGRCSLTDTFDVSDGNLPSAEDHLAEALRQFDDLAILRYVAACCTAKVNIVEYAPFGPEGACIGGTLSLTVDIS